MSGIFPRGHPAAALKAISQAVKRDEQQRALPSRSLPSPARDDLIAASNKGRKEADEAQKDFSRLQWRRSDVPRTSSVTPLSELERVDLQDLSTNTQATGRFLLVRIVAKPYAIFSDVHLVVEDPTGRVQRVVLNNVPLGSHAGADLDVLYPLGTILAIREPLFRLADTGSADDSLVLVESPTDVVVLHPGHPSLSDLLWITVSPTPDSKRLSPRQAGSNYFAKEKYRLAEATYSAGLRTITDPAESLLLYLNRSAAHLKLGNFAAAAQDASSALALLASSSLPADRMTKERALLRLARAFDGMRAFSKAKAAYLALVAHSPANSEATSALRRVEARLAEMATGDYDWVDVFERREQGERHLDVGNFFGPIHVAELPERGGGRGVVASRDIAVGELLVVEKAFATAAPPGSSSSQAPSLPEFARMDVTPPKNDDEDAKVAQSVMLDLVFNVVSRLVQNPALRDTVYLFHGGKKFPSTGGLPNATFGDEQELESPNVPRDVDPERVEQILWANVYALRRGMANAPGTDSSSTDEPPVAFFPFAAFFNHSCCANAGRETSGDVMFVRARRPIPAGTEIFVEYSNALDPDRAKQLAKHIPSGCSCDLCEAEEMDHELIVLARTAMAESAPGLRDVVYGGGDESTWIDTYEVIQRQIENATRTYRPTNPVGLRPAMFELYVVMAEHLLRYPERRIPDEVADTVLSAIASVGAAVELSTSAVAVPTTGAGAGASEETGAAKKKRKKKKKKAATTTAASTEPAPDETVQPTDPSQAPTTPDVEPESTATPPPPAPRSPPPLPTTTSLHIRVLETPYVLGSSVVEAMSISAAAYRDAGRWDEAEAWMGAAREMRRMLSGGGDGLFSAMRDGARFAPNVVR